MKLKKTWMGICVWVLFLILMLGAIVYTCFYSGLVPTFGNPVRAIITLTILVAGAIYFVLKKISDFLREKVPFVMKGSFHPVVEVLIPILVMTMAIVIYSALATGISVSGDLSLYDRATITEAAKEGTFPGFPESFYVGILHIFMQFTGNTINAAVVLQLIFGVLSILFLYIALRQGIGIFGALIIAVLISSIPVVGLSFAELSADNLLYFIFSLYFMLLVLYAKACGTSFAGGIFFKLFDIIMGLLLGLCVYLEPGMIVLISLLVAGIVIDSKEPGILSRIVNAVIFVISTASSFIGVFVYTRGSGVLGSPLAEYANAYLVKSENSAFDTLTNSRFDSLILCAVLLYIGSFFVFGFFRGKGKKRPTKAVPFVFMSMLLLLFGKLSEKTMFNTEVMVVVLLSILAGCGLSCVTFDERSGMEDEDAEAYESPEAFDDPERNSQISEIIMPETAQKEQESAVDEAAEEDVEEHYDETPEEETEEYYDETSEEETVEEDLEEVQEETSKEDVEEVLHEIPETQEIPDDVKEVREDAPLQPKKNEAPRYVPEGMVLPVGEEDEEDIVPHFNMNRQQMDDIGILSVGNKNDNNESDTQKDIADAAEDSQAPHTKDDFDIEIEQGDDFDI
ncbi:hypothetical protein [Butyrivibrio sp. NC2002]|uniref:hypothetical protein n=1 Tax=Butyrivibrio sp. NC2002 TaxID=1410610 RepID=UPI00068D924A|nr:hypothetical protein [Butyrivibrio sp. NC2002]